jgi:DEAD/DEAH box helicase domain-containing protein
MGVFEFLQELQSDPKTLDKIAHLELLPEKKPEYGVLHRPLPEDLDRYLAHRGIQLYTHQCCAINSIREGGNIILTTSTASGKTLAFNIPIFEQLLLNSRATALYLYPTKALTHDQLHPITEIEKYTGIPVKAAIYDGDTPRHRRARIRSESRIILSNPYEIHHILPWHHKWAEFFSNLQYLVIDEAHWYRGILGSHIALLIRRIRRIAHFYGADPQCILSTATIANPMEFGNRLTGKHIEVIDEDGSPSDEKYFLLYNPFSSGMGGESTHREASQLFVTAIRHGLQTLCFTGSRRMAELVTHWARESVQCIDNPPLLLTYKAGYLPDERREIERKLKTTAARGVVSTNALEVGIDVGSLDMIIMAGYPGTMMSTWQQAGRGGRRKGPSVAALIAFPNPLDQYLMNHPGSLFGKIHEYAFIDMKNPYILSGHLLCAASEAPLPASEAIEWFGDHAEENLISLEENMLLRNTRKGWIYCACGRATEMVNLNSIARSDYCILCGGTLLETMDQGQAFREAHPGAILLHQGETYLVEHFDTETRRIRVRKEETETHTEVLKHVDVRIISHQLQKDLNGIGLFFGEVEVVEHFYAYRLKRFDSVVKTYPLDLPPLQFKTSGMWFTIPERISASVKEVPADLAGGLHAVEHAWIGMMPLHVLCDRWDIGGFSCEWNPYTGASTILVYDGVEGGIGLSENAYHLFPHILSTVHDRVRDCSCDHGCPGCIMSPKCGNGNLPLDKEAGILVLEEMMKLIGDQDGPGLCSCRVVSGGECDG